MKPILALTMGDPAGVGPEICLSALSQAEKLDCVPVLFGDAGVLERVSRKLGRPAKFRLLTLPEWKKNPASEEPLVVDCGAIEPDAVKPGEVSAAAGKAAYSYIEHATRAAMEGAVQGVVTAPINKEALRLAGISDPGHTEIFTRLTGARRSCMMLRSEALTVSMVTTHIGYADVPRRLSVERVWEVIELTAEAMERMLRRPPRLAICGLNPHSGEHGLFGKQEEERFIEPAVQRARERGIAIQGPSPPDTVFAEAQRVRYDACVTMYHDQGHIPFKMLAFETGVNVTLGLPIVRTSVDHGTAFDIAWKGVANPRSMFEAVRVARELAATRTTEDPLNDRRHRG